MKLERRTPVQLSGIPETMLWALHNRASEARRPDTFLHDPDCIRICDSIAYDYERHFGRPDGPHAMRSRIFDDALRPWMKAHPGATVVELGCGLETQFQRCDDGKVRWVCVDVSEAIVVRERFLPESDRCRYIARSVLDLAWMDAVDRDQHVFITAQGLLMYFPEPQVRRLVSAMTAHFAASEILFDVIPHWLSRKTLAGLRRTRHYTSPPMPWAANVNELEPLLLSWSERVVVVSVVPYGPARGLAGAAQRFLSRMPVLRNKLHCIVHLRSTAGDP
jgi:O-methyltransferase involved in polyketide biosynthesis